MINYILGILNEVGASVIFCFPASDSKSEVILILNLILNFVVEGIFFLKGVLVQRKVLF